jgi:hypothetical protein
VTQTAAPVQFGDLLTALQRDTRTDLQTFLREYARGLSGRGARGFNRSIRWWVQAYRSTAIANTATLGTQPHDLSGAIRGQRDVFGALSRNVPALKGLVTNFSITASAFARNSTQLGQTVPALRNLLRTGTPALAALDTSFPSLRSFARQALPGVRSSVPALKASAPFVAQARGLVSEPELKGLAHDLRPTIPALAALNRSTIPFLEQSRLLSSCQNHVLLPFSQTPIPDPDFPANSDQPFAKQAPRVLVGLSGESRESDSNGPLFRGVTVAGPITILQPGEGGEQLIGTTAFPPEGTRPAKPTVRPRFRPDVPCETQQTPDLHAPRGDADSTVTPHPLPLSALSRGDRRFQLAAMTDLGRLQRTLVRETERGTR